jgi:segregation and condensation protein A
LTNTATYNIKLPQFEGPFDLLLFFIERDELDIYNIPIAKITDDFLGYIRHMEELNVDLASEFILVAATLCRIKAKMLLPRKPVDEEGNEIDPREELVNRLLEYKRYKSVLDEMRQLEEDRSNREHRGNVTRELRQIASVALVDVEMESLTLFKLLKTYERLLRKFEEQGKQHVVHTIVKFNYTIAEQRDYILSKIKPGKKTDFKSLFLKLENRIHAVVTFLALLELLNLQEVQITQGLGPNNFWVTKSEVSATEEEAEPLA